VTRNNVLGKPAVAYGLVYIVSDDGYLYAFREHCASTCTPAWRAFLSAGEDSFYASPAVANGVVYVGWTNSATKHGIDAFSATCATGGGTCSPLADVSGGYYEMSGPAVAGGELWATGGPQNGPGDLYAFGLPVPSRTSTGS
jgi:outer membrane protein assembly factor BamB